MAERVIAMAKSKSNKPNNAAISRYKNMAEQAKERGKRFARRANESRMVAKGAGSAGALAGAFAGARFARAWTFMDEKKDGKITKRGIDAAPLAGAGVMAAGLVTRGVLGDVLADSGGAIVGGALGAAGLCKALGLDLDAAWTAKKAAAK